MMFKLNKTCCESRDYGNTRDFYPFLRYPIFFTLNGFQLLFCNTIPDHITTKAKISNHQGNNAYNNPNHSIVKEDPIHWEQQ